MPSTFRSTLLLAGMAALATALAAAADAPWRPDPLWRPYAPAVSAPRPHTTPPSGITEFADEELKTYADASMRLDVIGSRWHPRIADASSPEDQKRLRRQAMDEMADAVQRAGLSVDRFNRIALAVQSDPDIARAVHSHRAARP